ncbi:23S rRNA (adenine(2503)-C(2))-methyltransferase RlmN [soil metagenome]
MLLVAGHCPTLPAAAPYPGDMADRPPTRYDLGRDALAEHLGGEPRYRLDQVWDGLYAQLDDPDGWTNVPKALRRRIAEELPAALAPAAESMSEDAETVKWLWELADGHRIETVLMHYDTRATVCVSSQAGCAMGCGFCATGQAGFDRNLSVGEIVEQVVRAARRAAPRRVSNVVFMGMGEPLANYDRTWAAVERIHDALGIGARHLTISTVGVVPGIRRLAGEQLPVSLAVSLHAANDVLRDELGPLNHRYPLASLMAACVAYREATGRRVSFEWALIDGVNDRPTDAGELAALARDMRAHVNLIPLNPTPGWPTRGTSPAGVAAFAERLSALGVNATIRQNRGPDIDAACGQLRADHPTPVSLK